MNIESKFCVMNGLCFTGVNSSPLEEHCRASVHAQFTKGYAKTAAAILYMAGVGGGIM